MVTLLNGEAWTNLELPLTWHDFGICTRNIDTSIEASFVVGIVQGSAERNITSH